MATIYGKRTWSGVLLPPLPAHKEADRRDQPQSPKALRTSPAPAPNRALPIIRAGMPRSSVCHYLAVWLCFATRRRQRAHMSKTAAAAAVVTMATTAAAHGASPPLSHPSAVSSGKSARICHAGPETQRTHCQKATEGLIADRCSFIAESENIGPPERGVCVASSVRRDKSSRLCGCHTPTSFFRRGVERSHLVCCRAYNRPRPTECFRGEHA